MGVSRFLSRLQRSESGNVLAIVAGVMPLLMGSAALAVDATQLALWKRQLQRVADSAAIAGAYSLTQNEDPAEQESEITAAVDNDIDENPHPPIVAKTIEAGPVPGYSEGVTVSLTSRRTLPFAALFTDRATTIVADATAALTQEGDYCMVSLYDGDDTGITLTGNSKVTLGCGMIANSRAAEAVTADGSAEVTATPIGAVGGLDGDTSNFVGNTVLLPYTAPQPDPYAYLPDPEPPSGCSGTAPVGVVLTAGSCYASWNVQPSETLLLGPGVHYIYGGDSTFHGTIKTVPVNGVEGATVIMTGPNGRAGDLTTNAQASIQIKPNTSGPYSGITFYRDRRAPLIDIQMNGGATSTFTGAYYFPDSEPDLQRQCGDQLDVHANGGSEAALHRHVQPVQHLRWGTGRRQCPPPSCSAGGVGHDHKISLAAQA
jgi:Flp pilus assembly protein TadG